MLLDWFDKVRIGLWLGFNQLDNNYLEVDPKFHIDSRIGQYDRLLIVEKSDEIAQSLNFSGIDTPSFSFTPSAFTLTVNNYYFTNISYMFLFSRPLGFPYPREVSMLPDTEKFLADFSPGTNRIMLPIIRRVMPENGVRVYQPMFPGGLMDQHCEEYECDYVRKHALFPENGAGNIFVEEKRRVSEYFKGDLIRIQPNVIQDDTPRCQDSW
jgi:hypothetical protein